MMKPQARFEASIASMCKTSMKRTNAANRGPHAFWESLPLLYRLQQIRHRIGFGWHAPESSRRGSSRNRSPSRDSAMSSNGSDFVGGVYARGAQAKA
jgi:hypothetical protein